MRISGKERENGKRKREIKQRFALTEHRAPWLLTLRGQPDLRNTLRGLLLDLSLTPIKGAALDSCSAAPQSPVFMFVLAAQWPPPSTDAGPHSVKPGRGKATATGDGGDGQGQLLIGYRCLAFD